MTSLALIVAMDENRLIGSNNGLPWHLPADLAFFKRTTLGKPVIMGRKTHESIGRPLPGRKNIVITSDRDYQAEGCEVVHSLEQALTACGEADEAMLIGGASLYQQTLEEATVLYITHIHHRFDGDTWFPDFDRDQWVVSEQQELAADAQNPYSCTFVKYVRDLC